MKRIYGLPARRGTGSPVRQCQSQIELVSNPEKDQLTSVIPDPGERAEELEDTVIGSLVKRLRRELAQLDDHYPVQPPAASALEALLATHQAAVKRRQRRELILFLLLAAVLVSGLTALLFQLPVLFLALQAAAVLLPLGYLLSGRGKRRESRWRP